MSWLATVLLDEELATAFEVDLIHLGLSLSSPARLLAKLALNPKPKTLLYNAVTRRENNGEVPWDDPTQLLMVIANGVNEMTYLQAHKMWGDQEEKKRKEADKPKPPERILPPGYVAPKPKMLTTASEVRDYMASLMNT